MPGDQAILICLRTAADLEVASALLAGAGLEPEAFSDPDAMLAAVARGAGALLLDATCLAPGPMERLAALIAEQPPWSDLPVIVLTGRRRRSGWRPESLGRSVTIVERPVASVALVSVVRAALLARRRQYDVRDLLDRLAAVNRSLEQRVTERTAELARSNAELQQFATIASHDLQEPLRVITLFVHLLQRHLGKAVDDEAREMIGHVVHAADGMSLLIRDLLEVARAGAGAGELERVDLERVVDAALERLALALEESGARVEREPLPAVLGNERELTQVFQNLIANAIKFTRAGGPPLVSITSRSGGERWVVAVRDNGIGIDPAHADSIFIPFKRLHGRDEYPGSGIGLAIVKKTVERQGGRVWVESAPGAGSTFFLALRRL